MKSNKELSRDPDSMCDLYCATEKDIQHDMFFCDLVFLPSVREPFECLQFGIKCVLLPLGTLTRLRHVGDEAEVC